VYSFYQLLKFVELLRDMTSQPQAILPSVLDIYASRDTSRNGPLAQAFATLFELSHALFEFLIPGYLSICFTTSTIVLTGVLTGLESSRSNKRSRDNTILPHNVRYLYHAQLLIARVPA
jgi:hypothetical protein